MMKNKVTILITVILVLLTRLSLSNVKAQAREVDSACVVRPINFQEWPVVFVDFRAISPDGRSLQSLGSDSVFITENGFETDHEELRITRSEAGIGLNLYFVIDQGNRTNQALAATIIQRFVDQYMIDNLDRITIISSQDTYSADIPKVLLPSTTVKSDIVAIYSQLQLDVRNPYSSLTAVNKTISMIQNDRFGCARPNIIIVLSGEDIVNGGKYNIPNDIISNALQSQVSIYVVNLPKQGNPQGQDYYQRISSETYGSYLELISSDTIPLRAENFTILDVPLFDLIKTERTTYTVAFRSVVGESIEREVGILIGAQSVPPASAVADYSVSVQNPRIEVHLPQPGAVISREVVGKEVTGESTYDVDNQVVEAEILFDDGYSGRIIESVELQVQSRDGVLTVAKIENPTSNVLQLDWDLRDYIQSGENPVVLQIVAIDEFGIEARSNTISVTVNVIKHSATAWITYILVIVVVILAAVIFITRRQLAKLTPEEIKRRLNEGVRKIKDTIIPPKNKKPLAKLTVIDGPDDAKGEEIYLYSELTRFGSDLSECDYAFYPDRNSSVSGLHCKIELIDHNWWITALSAKGSPTVVNKQTLGLGEKVLVNNGACILLGIKFQNCVELEFDGASSKRNTDVGDVLKPADETPVNVQTNSSYPENQTEVYDNVEDDDQNSDSYFDKYKQTRDK